MTARNKDLFTFILSNDVTEKSDQLVMHAEIAKQWGVCHVYHQHFLSFIIDCNVEELLVYLREYSFLHNA